MSTRTVNFTVLKPDGTGWQRSLIFKLYPGSYDSAGQQPSARVIATPDANGEGSVELWPNEGGEEASHYECTLPSRETFQFTVPTTAGPFTLSALREAGVTAADPQYPTIYSLVTTLEAKDWYVSPTGDDDNDGLTALTPFRTIQWAHDQLPPVIRHQQTINLAAGIHKENYLAAADPLLYDRPATFMARGRFITNRTTRDGETMTGGIVIRGADAATTFIENISGYDVAVIYAAQGQIGLEEVTLRTDGLTAVDELLISHRPGTRVEGVNVVFDCGDDCTGAVAEGGAHIELKNPTFINGTGQTAMQSIGAASSIALSDSNDALVVVDNSFTSAISITPGNTMQINSSCRILAPVTVQGGHLRCRGSAGFAVSLEAAVSLIGSFFEGTRCEVPGSATITAEGGSMLHLDNFFWDNQMTLDASFARIRSSNSYVSPAVASTVTYPINCINGGEFSESGTVNLVGSAGARFQRDVRTLSFTANSQTSNLAKRQDRIIIDGSGADRTGCQIGVTNKGEGDIIYVEGSNASGVQLVNGASMDLPTSITLGGASGEYTGATFILSGGKWRCVALGQVRP